MDIEHRMEDVDKLRCRLIQDFISLILVPDWKRLLFEKADNARGTYENNTYIPVYQKMRAYGIDNYNVNDMDVTLIHYIIKNFREIAPTKEKNTRDLLTAIKATRNAKDHYSYNSDQEKLYLEALISLCNLQSFLTQVDEKETTIEADKRCEFLQKWTSQINALKLTLDNERIDLIYKQKLYDADIRAILESRDPYNTWTEVLGIYYKHDNIRKSHEVSNEFVIRASDAGIPYAHSHAASAYEYKNNYEAASEKYLLVLESEESGAYVTVKEILSFVNTHKPNYSNQLIEKIKEKGYEVVQLSDGTYTSSQKV